MRVGKVSLFGLIVAALCSCSSSKDNSSPSGLSGEQCQSALDRLDSCAAEYCSQHDDSTCQTLSQGHDGSLLHQDQGPCSSMTQAQVSHLLSASCDQLAAEAQLLASGKADFPCPAYFPWCNALAPGNAGYRVNLMSYDSQSAQVEVIVPDVGKTRVTHDGQTFQALHLAGAGAQRAIGRPAVPAVSFLIGVPEGTDSAWADSYVALEEQSAKNIRLAPYQAPALEDSPPPDFQLDGDFYSQDGQYPGVDFEVDPVATWRNYRVVRVTVHPFQYNPAQKALSITTRLQLTVHFADQIAEPKDTVDEGESSYAGAYGSTLVNYPEVSGQTPPTHDDPDRTRFLIIANDPLIEALTPFVELKNSQALKTEVVPLSAVGADPVKIKERIAQAYQSSAIEYVMLVGDAADLPLYQYGSIPGSWESEAIPSDYWYGLLAGDDLLAEVSVGRLSGKTPEEIQAQVNKIVAYEKGDPNAAWRKKILLVAHEQEYPGKYTACSESVRSAQYKPGNVDFLRLYGGEHATTSQLVDTINAGVGMIAYRGHGSEEAWYEWNGEDFAAGKADLHNQEMLPVVFSIACLNGNLLYNTPSQGEQWMLNPSGGAVAFLGATQPSWTRPNDDFERHLFRTLLDDGVTSIGPLINRTRAALLTQYGNDNYSSDNVKMYLWLGDPSLQVGQAYQNQAPQVKVGWCNVQWPEASTVAAGAETELVFGQVWANGITEPVGQGQGVQASFGYGPAQSDPKGEGWTWVDATYNVDKGNNDEYQSKITAPAAGTYSYAYRFKGTGDSDWVYCDLDGSQNGIDPSKLGTLNVQ